MMYMTLKDAKNECMEYGVQSTRAGEVSSGPTLFDLQPDPLDVGTG